MPCFLIAQENKQILNWYNGKKPGMETEKAYKLLKKRTSSTVVVAVIDSGIDIEHVDLQGKIWINKNEIPGNGIDDDGNGYVDDVYGWVQVVRGSHRVNCAPCSAALCPTSIRP